MEKTILSKGMHHDTTCGGIAKASSMYYWYGSKEGLW